MVIFSNFVEEIMENELQKLTNEQDLLLSRIEESISTTNLSNLDRMKLMDQIQESIEETFFQSLQEARIQVEKRRDVQP